MDEELDSADFSKQFIPVWKQYVLFWKISGLVWLPCILISIFIPSARELIFKVMQFLFFATLACSLYYQLIKLRCPNCNCLVQFRRYGSGRLIFSGVCPDCGVRLKPRLLSEKMSVMVPAGIVIIAFLIIIVIAMLKGQTGITIERHHIDIPSCGEHRK